MEGIPEWRDGVEACGSGGKPGEEGDGAAGGMDAFFYGFVVETFGAVRLVLDAALKAAKAGTEEDHTRGVEEQGEAGAVECVEAVEIGFVVGVEVDVEFGGEVAGPCNETLVNASDGVFDVGPFLLGCCSAVELRYDFMRND